MTRSIWNRITPVQAGAVASIVAVFLLVVKFWAYTHTGSAAVLSSLLDSALDVLVSFMTWASLHYASRPPDEDHRYGHGKIEGVTALSQAVFMGAGALLLVYEGLSRLIKPQELSDAGLGIGVMVFAILMTLIVIRMQTAVMKHHHSLAIESDRGHYAGDAMINASTVVVLLIVPVTGWVWIDSLFALGVAGVTAWVAFGIARKAIDMLLDREVEDEVKHSMAHLVLQDPEIKRLHDLRVIRHGMRLVVSYDIELDGAVTLTRAHDIAVASEDRILAMYPRADIMVHMDPEGADHTRRHTVADGYPQKAG